MINQVFDQLDLWIEQKNQEAQTEGFLGINRVDIRIVGQTALLEANLHIYVAATIDVDTKNQIEYSVRKKFSELLEVRGKILDPVGHEAWMPDETEYRQIFDGSNLSGYIAEPVFVILSKAKKAPVKNKDLIAEYLASVDLDQRIFQLARKYQVDLDAFV